MKFTQNITLLLVLLATVIAYPQASPRQTARRQTHLRVVSLMNSPVAQRGRGRGRVAPRGAANDESWNTFRNAFRAAVRKRDRIALRELMSTNVEWA